MPCEAGVATIMFVHCVRQDTRDSPSLSSLLTTVDSGLSSMTTTTTTLPQFLTNFSSTKRATRLATLSLPSSNSRENLFEYVAGRSTFPRREENLEVPPPPPATSFFLDTIGPEPISRSGESRGGGLRQIYCHARINDHKAVWFRRKVWEEERQ